MKQLIIATLLIFAIMPRIKAQVSPIQGPPCPVDGKFEYDKEEKKKILNYYGINVVDCILTDNILFNRIIELRNSNFTDICNINKSTEDIINEILEKICALTGDKVDLLDKELKNLNGIRLHQSFDDPKYKRYKCLWEKLKNSGSSIYCNIIQVVDSDVDVLVQFSIQDIEGSDSRGITDNSNFRQVDISLNHARLKDDCDIFILNTIMHEFIHGLIVKIEIQSSASKKDINDYLPGYSDYLSIGEKWRDHTYMAEKFMKQMIQGLKDIYGSQYTDEEYEAIVWLGLWNTRTYIDLPKAKKDRIEELQKQIRSKCEKSCF
jgi:hypothetical protein